MYRSDGASNSAKKLEIAESVIQECAQHSMETRRPIELRLAAVDEAEAVGETTTRNRIGSVHFADRSQ